MMFFFGDFLKKLQKFWFINISFWNQFREEKIRNRRLFKTAKLLLMAVGVVLLFFLMHPFLFFVGLTVAILDRLKKRWKRRCHCREIIRIRRFSRIELNFIWSDRTLKAVWQSIPDKWYVDNLRTFTFQECANCKKISLRNVSNDPLSMWHLWCVNIEKPEQFYIDQMNFNAQKILEKRQYVGDADRKGHEIFIPWPDFPVMPPSGRPP